MNKVSLFILLIFKKKLEIIYAKIVLMDLTNTIAQIATASGNGAIAIIRLSGPEAFSITNSFFSKDVLSFPSHSAHLGKIFSLDKNILDEALVLVMKNPNSFTGEDVVEIHCHGGQFVTKKILQRVLDAGARPANPGEFTYRAFANKKIDLTKAEAIQKIISAKNDQALKSAQKHLEGALSKKISSFQERLITITAIIEASIDFPEEDLEFSTPTALIEQLGDLIEEMQSLKDTFEYGKIVHAGLTLCLCGSVNVGKSSLLNALLKKERAIVTDIAGTTRDLLQEDLLIRNFHLKAIDTAGIRETKNVIEKEGIKRSKKAMDEADILLCVLDAEKGFTEEDKKFIEELPFEKSLLVWNKIDKAPIADFSHSLPTAYVSAKEHKGISSLLDLLEKHISKSNTDKEEIILSEKRHQKALYSAIELCISAKEGLKSAQSPEFLSSDLQEALRQLSSIIGTDVTEDLLDAIFSQFCLGK